MTDYVEFVLAGNVIAKFKTSIVPLEGEYVSINRQTYKVFIRAFLYTEHSCVCTIDIQPL